MRIKTSHMLKFLSLTLVLVFFISFGCRAATHTTISDGLWDDANAWDNTVVPSANGDIIHIHHDVVLNQDVNFAFDRMIIHPGGSLKGDNDLFIRAGSRLEVEDSLRVYHLTFANQSVVFVTNTGNIKVMGDFVNKNNSDEVEINGSVDVDGDFDNGNGGEILGDGQISAGSFSGNGSTFGIQPNKTVSDGSTIPSLLPVELLHFSAECSSDNVELSWATASETNNELFILEQSDNSTDWEQISTLPGAGNSHHEIVYTEYDESGDGIRYYRLTQIDTDGSRETFDIVSADCSSRKMDMNVYIYPNPFSSELNIMLENWPEGDIIFRLTDMNGKPVDKWESSYGSLAIHKRIESSHIKPGIYVLEIISEDATKQLKIEKR